MSLDPHNLARSIARMHRRLRQERQSELTPTQLSVLGTIWRLGPSTPGAIAASERVQPPSLTRTLISLVDDGYVQRAPHPDDGRQALITISARGATVLRQEQDRRDAWLSQRVDELTDDERNILAAAADLLGRLADS